MALKVEEITLEDDLDSLVAEINNSYWDEPNEISEYDVGSLKAYLKRKDTIFLACHEGADEGAVLLGIASLRIEMSPMAKNFGIPLMK